LKTRKLRLRLTKPAKKSAKNSAAGELTPLLMVNAENCPLKKFITLNQNDYKPQFAKRHQKHRYLKVNQTPLLKTVIAIRAASNVEAIF